MKRDFLKGLEIDDTIIEQIMAEHGKTVNTLNLDKETLLKDKTTLQTQLAERDGDLAKLKESANLSEEQKTKFNELQQRYDTEKAEWETKLNENVKQSAWEVAIAKANVIDPVALKAHTKDFYDKAELKDGEIVGFNEHVKELLGDKLAYLVPTDKKALGGNLDNPPKNEKTKEDQMKESMGL